MRKTLNIVLLSFIVILNISRFNLPVKFDNISNFDLIGSFAWFLLFLHYFIFDVKYKETKAILLWCSLMTAYWFVGETIGTATIFVGQDVVVHSLFFLVSVSYYIIIKQYERPSTKWKR